MLDFLLIQAALVAGLTLVGQCLFIDRAFPATVRLGEFCDSIQV